MTAYLDLADYLLIAEAVLGVPAELIADFNRIGLADSALAAPQDELDRGQEGALISQITARALSHRLKSHRRGFRLIRGFGQTRCQDPHELSGRRRSHLGPRLAGWCFTVECDRPRRWAAAFSDPATRTEATTLHGQAPQSDATTISAPGAN